MDNVVLLSKFKSNLGDVISDYKNKVSDIQEKKVFLQKLSDLINCCRSDALLLPFYDDSLLNEIFEVVFPMFDTKIKKIKTAKYLIDSCKNVDKDHFPQYNSTIDELNKINDELINYYDNLLATNTYDVDCDNFNMLINSYSSIYDLIGESDFAGLIEDIDLFHDVIYLCNLSDEEVNGILDIAIKSNLVFLNDSGVLEVDVDCDNRLKEATLDLSNLIDSSL